MICTHVSLICLSCNTSNEIAKLFQKVAVRSHVQHHELCGQIGNAIKFTLEGEVKLSVYLRTTTDFQAAAGSAHTKCQLVPNTTLEYRYLHIDVQDTGIGIKPMDMPRLFNKFVQGDSSTTRNFGGTGLGLAISKKFVQVLLNPQHTTYTHCGSITLFSIKTTFHWKIRTRAPSFSCS